MEATVDKTTQRKNTLGLLINIDGKTLESLLKVSLRQQTHYHKHIKQRKQNNERENQRIQLVDMERSKSNLIHPGR